MSNITEGGKRANAFLKTLGHKPEFHDGASLANIISGYHPARHMDLCRKETKNYLHRYASMRLDEAQIDDLIHTVHAGL